MVNLAPVSDTSSRITETPPSAVNRHHVGGVAPLKYNTMCLATFHQKQLSKRNKIERGNPLGLRRICFTQYSSGTNRTAYGGDRLNWLILPVAGVPFRLLRTYADGHSLDPNWD